MELEKVTGNRSADTKRRYDDACGTAHALELIGGRWSLLVLRELMLGPRRFSGLKADLPGISANVLNQRLAELEHSGLVVRRRLPPPASVQVYEATPWALEAEPIVQELGRWAARSPRHDPSLPISGVSILLSFRTMIDRAAAHDWDKKIGFRFGDTTYLAHVHAGEIDVVRGEVAGCDVLFEGAPAEIAALVYGGAPLDLVRIEGDRALAARFAALFTLPTKLG